MKRAVRHFTVVLVALVCVAAAVLAGCGTTRQNVHVQHDVESLDARTRFDPVGLALPEGLEISSESIDTFDATLEQELGRRGLLGSMGEAATLEVRPAVVSYQVEGGIEQSFVATGGDAVIRIDVVLIDRDGRRVGRLRATERSEVVGVVPKLVNPELMHGAAEALAEELATAVDSARGKPR